MAARRGELTKAVAQGAMLAAAADVFGRLGFAASRVEDILEAAGIARRTFYKSFRGKEEVLAALYDLATRQLLDAIASGATAEEHTKPLHGLERALDAYLDYHVDNALLVKVLVEQAIRSDSPLAARRRRFRSELVRVIDAAVREHAGRAHDPMLYAALVSALEGLSLDLLSEGPSPEKVARAKKAMHFLLERVLAPE